MKLKKKRKRILTTGILKCIRVTVSELQNSHGYCRSVNSGLCKITPLHTLHTVQQRASSCIGRDFYYLFLWISAILRAINITQIGSMSKIHFWWIVFSEMKFSVFTMWLPPTFCLYILIYKIIMWLSGYNVIDY